MSLLDENKAESLFDLVLPPSQTQEKRLRSEKCASMRRNTSFTLIDYSHACLREQQGANNNNNSLELNNAQRQGE